jgi:GH15 family glucan-1,4-alpha-glucosidase
LGVITRRPRLRLQRRRWGRRETSFVVVAALVAALGFGGVAFADHHRGGMADIDPYLDTMALDWSGTLTDIPPGQGTSALEPGTRVVRPPAGAPASHVAAARELAAAQRRWLAAGTVPGAGTAYAGMARDALLDLRTMTLSDGAVLAAGSADWRYAWPRDGAFAVVAYAKTGHLADARRVLGFFQRMQPADGRFAARYLPDGSGTPDNRPSQLDGVGWMLWSLGTVVDATPAADRASTLADLRQLLDRSTQAAESSLGSNGLPSVSPDYWEVRETKLTLGTAAPLLAGLRSSAAMYSELGDLSAASTATASADRLSAAITKNFGPTYGRYEGSDQRDAAVSFLLPPFTATADPQVVAALKESVVQMARPAGGLAPGASWKHDGLSWTPETAIVALGAVGAGDDQLANHLLTWLDDHRTPAGSLSEKVSYQGQPVGTAPLVWSGATVLIALSELDAAG